MYIVYNMPYPIQYSSRMSFILLYESVRPKSAFLHFNRYNNFLFHSYSASGAHIQQNRMKNE